MITTDSGLKLLEVLRKQRRFFTRTADGNKIISNYIMYDSLENEAFELQKKIGLENKKRIAKELNGKPFPDESGHKIRNL